MKEMSNDSPNEDGQLCNFFEKIAYRKRNENQLSKTKRDGIQKFICEERFPLRVMVITFVYFLK